jgi:hypothetical protein
MVLARVDRAVRVQVVVATGRGVQKGAVEEVVRVGGPDAVACRTRLRLEGDHVLDEADTRGRVMRLHRVVGRRVRLRLVEQRIDNGLEVEDPRWDRPARARRTRCERRSGRAADRQREVVERDERSHVRRADRFQHGAVVRDRRLVGDAAHRPTLCASCVGLSAYTTD